MNIAFTENTHPGTLPPSDQLGFGSVFTDHMFLMDYSAGKGWHDARIVPYGPISLSPAVEAFQKVSDNEYLVDCSTNLDDLLEYFRLKSDSEASTINGWVIEQLDRIPEKGDCFDFENLHVVVEETEYQRATRVRITVSPKKEESEEA